eukprot:gene15796-21393_t
MSSILEYNISYNNTTTDDLTMDDDNSDDIDDYYDDETSFHGAEAMLLKDEFSYSTKSNSNFNQDFSKKVNLSNHIQNDIIRVEKKSEKKANQFYGKDDRATSEQVLDPRTRLIIFKLLNNGFLDIIDGCLSTGKEANVYYAKNEEGKEYAVKIFKTSILVFKDRDKYVSGEYRFRNGYCKSNPRKMVKTWAEKEMRNLKRLSAAGIPCPTPHLLKSHVLVMDFLGKDGWCASRLKDATLSMDELLTCYKTIVIDMRRMYHECNLVHGDLSEYNLLWYEGRAVIIDVSQSVEQSHPLASDFLRKDITNITDFFSKKGIQVLNKIELYHFIVNKYLIEGYEDFNNLGMIEEKFDTVLPYDILQKKFDMVLSKSLLKHENDDKMDENEDNNNQDEQISKEVTEAVFLQAYIPTSLNDISNPYQELDRIRAGQREAIFEQAVQGMLGKNDDPKKEKKNLILAHENSDNDNNNNDQSDADSCSSDEVSEENDEESDDFDNNGKYRRALPSRDDPEQRKKEKELRKEARKIAKEEKAEKRKTKIPKHIKKRSVKGGKK